MSIIEEITLLEEKLNDLVIKYEQYFLGIEKREPLKLRESVEQSLRYFRNVTIVNTMLKFKINSLAGRFATYQRHWTRIGRLIEEGKYSRERFRLERKNLGKAEASTHPREEIVGSAEEKLDIIDEVYQRFLEARQACNLPVNSISRDLIAEALEKQKPLIREKYKCDRIDFTVVIEDGTPKIKARPHRPGNR